MSQPLSAGTPCWVNNPHPGIKSGTAVLLLEDVQRVNGEAARVRTEAGKEATVSSLSLSSMLPEEIPDWMSEHPGMEATPTERLRGQ